MNNSHECDSQNRQSIRLDDENMIASAQIAGWLAFPDRPLHGVQIVQQWWLRRRMARGDDLSAWPVRLDKPNRLQSRIDTLDFRLRRTLRAGDWLNKRIALRAHEEGVKWNLGKGLRQLARDETQFPFGPFEMSEANAITAYWTKNKPVLPLANSALFAIIEALYADGYEGWHLARILFDPDWVESAIEGCENTASWADMLGVLPLNETIRFHRD